MSEFKIKVNVELDAEDLQSQLKNLGEQEINIKRILSLFANKKLREIYFGFW